MSEEVSHKTDVGGVVVDIRNDQELKSAFERIEGKAKELGVTDLSFLVQQMIKGGREVILGLTQDPSFGPLIMFGLGGIFVEIMKDVNFSILPLTDVEAERLVTSLRGVKLLQGFRGEKAVSFDKIFECLGRLSQLVSDFHQIKEMDINPLIVFPDSKKTRVVDARISLKID